MPAQTPSARARQSASTPRVSVLGHHARSHARPRARAGAPGDRERQRAQAGPEGRTDPIWLAWCVFQTKEREEALRTTGQRTQEIGNSSVRRRAWGRCSNEDRPDPLWSIEFVAVNATSSSNSRNLSGVHANTR